MIYYVEDDESIRDLLLYALRQSGFEAEGFPEAASFCAAIDAEHLPDLILLDIMLPGEDGISLLRRLKSDSHTAAIPVIMLTAKGSEYDKVLGLDVGADDYVTKPFNPVELLARVRSQLRRYLQLGGGRPKASRIRIGGILLDTDAGRVLLDGEPVELTPREFDILSLLMRNAGTVFAPREIYRQLWNEEPLGAEKAVAVHIRHLREKLEINPAEPRWLKVVWGKGYKMEREIQ